MIETGHAAPILVSDVGGTNTRIALVDGQGRQIALARYANDSFASYYDVLARFIEQHPEASGLSGLCVAIAGPVTGERAELTNRNWHFCTDRLVQHLDALCDGGFVGDVCLLNDLAALGHALQHLEDTGLEQVTDGADVPSNDQALVLGLGTGFNGCLVKLGAAAVTVGEAEIGHAGIPAALLTALSSRISADDLKGFPTNEDLFSGRGLTRLNKAMFGTTRDGAELCAAYGTDAQARETLDFMGHLLGIFCREMVYFFMPFQGIFLAGSVARGVLGTPARDAFVTEFRRAGMFSGQFAQIPVRIITEDAAALTGNASYLRQIATP